MPVMAATPGEFYLSLLRRGVASYDATRYADAAKQLRTAAFGLVDSIEYYQLAQMYLALSWDKLGDQARAREAAHRVIVAERIERKYGSVPVPASVRNTFEVVAGRLLSPSELASLRGGNVVIAPPTPSTTNLPQTSTTIAPPPATQPQPQPQPARPAVVTPAPQTTTPERTAPQTITPPVPTPVKPKPEVPAPTPAIKPPATGASTETPGRGGPVEPPRPTIPAAPRPLTATEIATRFAAADRALTASNLPAARSEYRELLAAPNLDHDALVRLAEGLYRARDFAAALRAFARIGTLRRGEEPFRYYIAVAAYETGDYARAKRELAAALPYIEITPDVARNRARIEGAP